MDLSIVEPADVDVGVMQVEAKPHKLRNLNRYLDEMEHDKDVRYCFASIVPSTIYRSVKEDALSVWKVGDYGRTMAPIGEGELRLPRGTYVVVKEVVDRSYTTEELDERLPVSGIRLVFEALHPRDPNSRVTFVRWDALPTHDMVEKVEHELTVIAIAATGL